MENNNSLPKSGKKSSVQIRELVSAALLLAIIIVMSTTPLGFIRLGVTALTIIHVPVIIGSIILGPKYGAFLGFAFGMASMLNATFAPDATSFAFSPFYSVGELEGNAWSLVIAFVPRILTGIVPYFAFLGFKKLLSMKYAQLISYIIIILAFVALSVYKLVELNRDTTTPLVFDFLIYVSMLLYVTGEAISKRFKFKSKETMPFVVAGVLGSLTNTVFVLGFMWLFFGQALAGVVGTSIDLLYRFIFTIIATNGFPEAIFAGVVTVAVCKAVMTKIKKSDTA